MDIVFDSLTTSRNGIGGVPFLRAAFRLNDGEYGDTPLLAVIPLTVLDPITEQPHPDGYGPSGEVECFVINMANPADTLRGDVIYRALYDAGMWHEYAARREAGLMKVAATT